MALRIISLLLSIISALSVAPSYAASGIEEIIFQDCEAAKDKFSKLSQDEQRTLFDFLARVVTLNTQAPAAPEPFAHLPGQNNRGDVILPGSAKGPELISGSLWQTMDAKRELLGKRCALELFSNAGATALSFAPKLASIYSQENLSDEIAVTLEESAASIAEQAHKAGINPSDQEIDTVVALLPGAKPLVAQNFLQEYVVLSLPRIAKYLSTVEEGEAYKITPFLKELDPDGSRGIRTLLDLLVTLDPPAQQRLANYLPFPSKQALAQFIPEFARLAAEPSKNLIFAPLLGKACLLLDGLTLETTVASAFNQATTLNSLEPVEQACLVRSIPSFAKRVTTLLSSTLPSEQEQALRLLPSAVKLLNSEQKLSLLNRIKETALRSQEPQQVEAIYALALFPERRGESVSILLQIIKRLESMPTEVQDKTRAALLGTISTMGYSKETARLTPFVINSLATELNTTAASLFSSTAIEGETELLKLLKPSTPDTTSRVLMVLDKRKSLSKKVAAPLFDLLGQPGVSRGAERVLARLPATLVLSMIKRSLPRSNGEFRIALLSLLQTYGLSSKSETTELLSLLMGDGCSQFDGRTRSLQALLHRKELDPALRYRLEQRLVLCLSETSEAFSGEWLTLAEESVLSHPAQIAETLRNHKISDEFQTKLIDSALRSNMSSVDLSQIALVALEHGSRPSRLKFLTAPNLRDLSSAELIKATQTVVTNAKNDEELRLLAIRALALLNDTSYDWKDFIKNSIDTMAQRDRYDSLLAVIRLLPPQLVLDEVLPALNSDNQDKLVGACRVGAALGAQAVPIISKLWNLREKRAPSVRYAAVLALLEINPLTPELQEHLKRLLVNRYFPRATVLPIRWRSTVAVVDLNAASFGTLRTVHLERLLSNP